MSVNHFMLYAKETIFSYKWHMKYVFATNLHDRILHSLSRNSAEIACSKNACLRSESKYCTFLAIVCQAELARTFRVGTITYLSVRNLLQAADLTPRSTYPWKSNIFPWQEENLAHDSDMFVLFEAGAWLVRLHLLQYGPRVWTYNRLWCRVTIDRVRLLRSLVHCQLTLCSAYETV